MVLEASPPGPSYDDTEESRARLPILAASVLALTAVGLVILGLALAGDDPNANASPSAAEATTTTLETTTTTSSVAITDPVDGDLQALLDDFEALLLEQPRSDLNPPEVEDVMKKVDEAVALTMEGESREAEEKLSEVAERVDDKVERESRDEVLDILQQIADALGIEFDGADERDDDD